MDGWVTLGTRVSTKQAERDLKRLEKELVEYNEKGEELLNQKAEIEMRVHSNVEQEEKKLEDLKAKAQAAREYFTKLYSNRMESFETYEEFMEAEPIVRSIVEKVKEQENVVKITNGQYGKTKELLDDINGKIEQNAQSQKRVKNEVEETKSKLVKGQIQDALTNINKKASNTAGKILKWGLALIGIRGIMSMISSSMSILSSQNKQLGTDLEYMRWVIAVTLQPIIEGIIRLLYTALQYINYIANAWFGVNIFANASADAFQRTKDNIKGTNAEAKKLHKTLAGFDEMNILQDNGSVSGGGGGGGVPLPTTDLSQLLPEAEAPGWLQWLAENGNLVKEILIGIGTAIATMKILDFLKNLGLLGEGFSNLKKVIVTAGIVLIIQGFIGLLGDIADFIENGFSWSTLWDAILHTSEILGGLGAVILMFSATNPVGWVMLAIAGIGLFIQAIGNLVTAEKEERDMVEEERDATERLKQARDNLTKVQSKYAKAVDRVEQSSKNLKQAEEETRLSGQKLYNQVTYGAREYKNLTEEERRVYQAYLDNKDAEEQLTTVTEELRGAKNEEWVEMVETNRVLAEQKKGYEETFATMLEGVRDGSIKMQEFQTIMSNILGGLEEDAAIAFVQKIPEDIRASMEASKAFGKNGMIMAGDIVLSWENLIKKANGTFKVELPSLMQFTTKAVDKVKSAFNNIGDLLSKLTGKKFNINFGIGGVSYNNAKGGVITKLATGAIVNQPGRGVPVASSYMGEAGREGILPLTDSQAMETLGQAIGKYISINATVPVYVGNRQVAREIRKIEAEDDFAYNS